jgi:hypothetical protein
MDFSVSQEGIMFLKNRIKLLVVVSFVLIIAASAASKPRKMQRMSTGSWGAPHIRIEVGQRSASIDYDCANGTIDGPLTLDSKGRFNWRGTHTREGPGPIRVEAASDGQPAIYTGSVKGDTMTLTVKLADSNQVVDTFTLKRGGAGRVFKCK